MPSYSHKITKLREWYQKHERRFSTVSLISGFVFDSLTVQRIDAIRENLWIIVNILLVAIFIFLVNKHQRGGKELSSENEPWKHFWFLNILQFGFGSLLGSFFILYFRSATLVSSWPFLLILLSAIIANELLKKRYVRLVFQISYFYLSIFSFSIFLLPLLLHKIGPTTFLLSGVASLALLSIFIFILKNWAGEKFHESRIPLARSIVVIFLGINILYFTNIIPPIPLSLREAGIYHQLSRSASGDYIVGREKKNFLRYFHLHEKVNWVQGDPLYAYSAIFTPAELNTNIVHEWQYKDLTTGKWVTATRIPLFLSGGRASGFRTYSTKSNLTPGPWRVNVETPQGQLIGRISFNIIPTDTRPSLEVSTK